jgi:hypothetical protein
MKRRTILAPSWIASEAAMQSHQKLLLRSKEVRCIPSASAVQYRISRPWSNSKFFTPAYRKRERPGLQDPILSPQTGTQDIKFFVAEGEL